MIHHRYHRAGDDGQARAIQTGWDALGADIYGWLNADDRLMPGALAKVAEAFAANPEVDVVYGHALLIDGHGGFLSYFPTITRGLDRLPVSNVICQPACFIRRRALTRIGGLDPRLHYVMDWDLWLRAHEAGSKFLFLDQVLAVVIDHPESKTNKGGEQRYAEIAACLRTYVGGRKSLASMLRHRGSHAHRQNRHLRSLLLRGSALLLDPSGRGSRGNGIGGIRLSDRRVTGACRVPLPWYEPGPATRLLVAARPFGDYRVRCNGSNLTVRGDKSGACFSVDLPPAPERLYDVEIMCAERTWRLLDLRLVR